MKVMEIETKYYQFKSDTWKTQLAMAINFISPEGTDGEHVMHSKVITQKS